MTRSYDIALFGPSDGLTPIQAKKLNQNFSRLLELVSGADENNEAIVKTTTIVQDKLQPLIMDAAYPIGCIILAKDADALPKWGKWREVSDFNGRFMRLGTTYGGVGGSSSQTITPQLPEHTHTFIRDIYRLTEPIKVDVSTKSDAKTVYTKFAETTTTPITGPAGEEPAPQTISTIPPYVTMKMYERYE